MLFQTDLNGVTPSTPVRVVNKIADEKDVKPENLELQIQNHVPTDAIRYLEKHKNDQWRLQFETPDYIVEVAGGDTVTVNVQQHDAVLSK